MPAKVLRVEPQGEHKVSALGHGYRVNARVTVLERPNALLLPVESLIRTAQGWRAWVLTDGRPNPAP